MSEEPNVFKEMANADVDAIIEGKEEQQQTQAPVIDSGEVDYDKISDTAVGEKKKYNRVSLDGQEVIIEKAQLFNADTSNEKNLKVTEKSGAKYYNCNFIITYDKINEEEMNHREYISGVKQWVQRDGTLSDHNFWYEGCDTQSGKLWMKVAVKKGMEPKDLSPREFMAFLNNKPKAKLVYELQRKHPEQKEATSKNMVAEFL